MADAPALGVRGWLRWIWAQLTSMRTALILLFALALVAIPGSLLPQRPTNPIRVMEWKNANPAVADLYEAIGLFDVYGSPWFAAVYLLLLVSLVGCIVPRIGVYGRALKTPPPRTPKRLTRLPASASGVVAETPDAVLAAAASHLKKRRFRVVTNADSVASERGYLREFGNLLFHLSFVALLVGIAWSSLFGFKGEVIVVEGRGFSNNLTQYDDFTAGSAFRSDRLAPFSLTVDEFIAKFETGPVQRGAARQFTAKVRTSVPGGPETPGTLEVNHPIYLGGTAVHLIGHGYAPVVTVTDPQGKVAFSGPVVFLPQDGNFRSLGVVKVPDARPQRLAFEGFFLPTGIVDDQGPRSIFPDALQPRLFLNAWQGAPKQETGVPENIYTLDKVGLDQMAGKDGNVVSFQLAPGQIVDLPDGSKVSFDDWKRWTKLQVSENPGLPLVFGAVALSLLGLALSLYIRPRRMWVRATASDEGTLVEVAGLDRTSGRGGLADELTDLAAAVGIEAPGASDADETAETDEETE